MVWLSPRFSRALNWGGIDNDCQDRAISGIQNLNTTVPFACLSIFTDVSFAQSLLFLVDTFVHVCTAQYENAALRHNMAGLKRNNVNEEQRFIANTAFNNGGRFWCPMSCQHVSQTCMSRVEKTQQSLGERRSGRHRKIWEKHGSRICKRRVITTSSLSKVPA